MITPTAVTELASPLLELYQQMEDDLIRNLASRLSVEYELTGTTEWQIKQMQELGMLNKQNIRTIAKYSRRSEELVSRVIAEAGFFSVLADETIYQMAATAGAVLVAPVAVEASPIMRRLLDETIRNAKAEMNLVNTTALETSKKLFVDTVNQVFLEVQTGTYSYDQAVRKAVQKIGAEGIKGAHYISDKGRHTFNQLDVAVKRAVLTSSSQVAGQMQLARAEEWGSNYVEVTSHVGARPDHAVWQGKVFMLKGSNAEYQNFYDVTGYGEVDGLKGANCQHDFYPFFPGVSTQRFHPVPLDENEKAYEAAQKQRKLERDIRAEKRKAIAAEAAGDQEGLSKAGSKLKAKREELRQHVADTGRARRSNREQIVGYTRGLEQKASSAARAYLKNKR